jgi:rhodanese-related sulfurtransferase
MSIRHIDAREAKRLVDGGAILIDVREPGEHAAENIPGARNHPLSTIAQSPPDAALPTVIYHCKSGGRTRMASAALSRCSSAESYIMDGGIEAWKAAGFPVSRG